MLWKCLTGKEYIVAASSPGRRIKLAGNEQELIEKAKQGETEAFRQLYEGYKIGVFNFILHMVGQRQDAEDILQDVFVKMHKKLPGLRETRYFSTWLFSIAKNEAINYSKRNRRRLHEAIDDSEGCPGTQSGHWVVSKIGDPQREAANRELEAQVESALAKVPELYRAAFVLGVLEGYSYKEVADILGCTVNNVKSRVFRARAVLSVELKPYFETNLRGS
ncbi:MAG: RNA polymerase sigma factor [bacterium]